MKNLPSEGTFRIADLERLVKQFGYPVVHVNIKVKHITKYRYDKKKNILYFC